MRIDLIRSVLVLTLVTLMLPVPTSADAPAGGGPRNLLITYRSKPADRPAFRTYLQGEGSKQFDRLKREGVLSSYQILFNPFTSSGTWDALAILGFARFEDTQRWIELERTAPGGLTAAGLQLAQPVDTYLADLPWQATAEPAPKAGHSIYYVIPYEYASADQYRKYVDGYVLPQVRGWMREGVLGSYRIFMNRHPVGTPWDSLFIYEYRDLTMFGRRDETVARVRATLVSDPVWQKFHENKQSIRTESENTIAEALPGQ